MTNVERFWEASTAEAVGGREPPDQTGEILARLNAAPGAAPKRRWPRVVRYPLELAAAAALILAIGWLTGVIRWPDGTPETPDPDRTWIAGPDSRAIEVDGALQLEAGYLLARTGTPDVRRGESLFTGLDGLAVIRAGDPPTAEEQQAIQTWLTEREIGEDMLNRATRWAAGAAMCVLMLQGTAQLDGQEVKAEEERAPAPVWHEVTSAMDLDRLPADAKYVKMSGMSAEYLPVIARVPRLEGVAFLQGTGFTTEYLDSLTKLPQLRVLDVRGGKWEAPPDYAPLMKMGKLQVAGLDLHVPKLSGEVSEEQKQARDNAVKEQIGRFKAIAERGVKLNFWVPYESVSYLPQLREAFPDTAEVWASSGSEEMCQQLAQFKGLGRLRVDWCSMGELGYVYLSALTELTDLALQLNGAMEESYVHHLAKMKGLRTLSLDCTQTSNEYKYVKPGVVSVLAGMTQLIRLDLSQHYWTQLAILDGRETTPFSANSNLQVFSISVDEGSTVLEQIPGGGYRHPFDLGFLVGAREIRIYSTVDQRFNSLAREDVPGGNPELAKRLEVLRVGLREIRSSEEPWQANWAGGLKRYPGLKRVEIERLDGGKGLVWHGGRLAAGINEKLPSVEVVDVSAQ